jgi:hypothetical protein
MSIYDVNKWRKYLLELQNEKKEKKTYLAYNVRYELYKIGKSDDPFNRVDELNIKHKGTILLKICQFDIENKLHKFFKHKKVLINNEREWFSLNQLDINDIEYFFSNKSLIK